MKNPYIDITAGHHGGNKQSQEANKVVAPYKTNWRERVLGLMALRDEQGLGTTCRQAADYFGRESGHLSPRFTELKADKLIEETGIIENGFMVYRLPGSGKVPIKPTKRGRLTVTGHGFAGEGVFEKGTGGWQIATISLSLASLIGETPISEIKALIKSRGLTYKWEDL